MGLAKGGDDVRETVRGAEHFQAKLRGALETAGTADGGMRTGAGAEGAFAGAGKGTVAVVTEGTGTGVDEGLAERLSVGGWHEDDELELQLIGGRGGGAQRAHAALAEASHEPVVDSAGDGVEGGVGAVEGDAVLAASDEDALPPIGGGEGGERVKDGRVVGDDELAAAAKSFGEHGRGEVDGEQGAADRPVGVAEVQAGLVPGFGEVQRSERGDAGQDVCKFHAKEDIAATMNV